MIMLKLLMVLQGGSLHRSRTCSGTVKAQLFCSGERGMTHAARALSTQTLQTSTPFARFYCFEHARLTLCKYMLLGIRPISLPAMSHVIPCHRSASLLNGSHHYCVCSSSNNTNSRILPWSIDHFHCSHRPGEVDIARCIADSDAQCGFLPSPLLIIA